MFDGKVLLAHNNDTSFSCNMLLHVTPNRDGFFGRACISMETVPGWVPTGMKCINDQGIALTHANVPQGETPFDPDKPQFRHNFLEKIVAECPTVKEASVANVVSVLKEVSTHARRKGDEVGSIESAVFDVSGRNVHCTTSGNSTTRLLWIWTRRSPRRPL